VAGRRPASPVLALAGLVFLLYLVQSRIDETYGEYRATEEILYVEDGKLLKKFMMGFESVAADLYWLRTVQYFGGKRLDVTTKNYALLEPLLWITVELDPNFKIAYTYGATFLSEPFPMGAALPLKGVELIEEGIRNHPDYWRFYLDKGFIYFTYLEDYDKAAEIFLEGSKIDGAPYWMVTTASRTLARGGKRDMSRELWKYVHDTAETDQQRENAVIHLKQLDALDQMDVLKQIVGAFESQRGHFPASWEELVEARFLDRVPEDPTGAPYQLEPDGNVKLSSQSSLGALPVR
jgi:tetratricopeptide (TPR) repeat protein